MEVNFVRSTSSEITSAQNFVELDWRKTVDGIVR